MKFLASIYKYYQKRNQFYLKYKFIYLIISLGSLLFWVFAFKSSVFDANNIPTGSMTPTLKIGDLLFVNKMRYSLKVPFTNIILFYMDKPKRGDIVTFTPPERPSLNDKTLVKRVVGVPGDTVRVVDHEVIVNGVKYPVKLQQGRSARSILEDLDYPKKIHGNTLDNYQLFKEKVIDPKTKETIVDHYIMKRDIDENFPTSNLRYPSRVWVIPEDRYMVMGDNRDDSEDSREWGLVSMDLIHGKVFMVYFSVNWGYRLETYITDDNPFSKNPLINFIQFLGGNFPNTSVRWDRIGKRVY